MTINRFVMSLQIHPLQNSLTFSWYKVMRIVSRRLVDDVKLDCVRWSLYMRMTHSSALFSLHNNINLMSHKYFRQMWLRRYIQRRHKIILLSINSKVINLETFLLNCFTITFNMILIGIHNKIEQKLLIYSNNPVKEDLAKIFLFFITSATRKKTVQ